jgi:hypothetical protein
MNNNKTSTNCMEEHEDINRGESLLEIISFPLEELI